MPLTNQSTRFCQKYSITAMTLVTIITLTGCATTKIGSRDTARAIIDQRISVLSGSRLSYDTKSRLVQAGLDEEKCLANMPACVVTLKQADLNTDKGIYGAISELFYASAQQRQQAKTCTNPPAIRLWALSHHLIPTNAQSPHPYYDQSAPHVDWQRPAA